MSVPTDLYDQDFYTWAMTRIGILNALFKCIDALCTLEAPAEPARNQRMTCPQGWHDGPWARHARGRIGWGGERGHHTHVFPPSHQGAFPH